MENNFIYIFMGEKNTFLNNFRLAEKASLTSDSPPLENVTRRAHILSLHAFYTLYQRIWKFVPQRRCHFFSPLFKHAIKSAADCPYVTVYGMQVSRRKPVDYTLGTCCSFGSLAVVLLDYAAPPEM